MEHKLSYEEFQEILLESVRWQLHTNGTYHCEIMQTPKNNVMLTGLKVRQEGSMSAPVFYLEHYYRDYLEGKHLNQISQELVTLCQSQELPDLKMIDLVDYKKVKDKLRVRLVSRENNQAFYKQGPYRLHPLGAQVLYIELEKRREGSMHIHVTNVMAEQWKVPEGELLDIGLQNTQSSHKVKICSLNSLTPDAEGVPLYYLGNDAHEFGATVALFPDVLMQLQEQLGGDYYILPASIHELLVVKKHDCPLSVKDMKEIVRDVNENDVSPEEVLGSEVYEFCGAANKVKKCSKEDRER